MTNLLLLIADRSRSASATGPAGTSAATCPAGC